MSYITIFRGLMFLFYYTYMICSRATRRLTLNQLHLTIGTPSMSSLPTGATSRHTEEPNLLARQKNKQIDISEEQASVRGQEARIIAKPRPVVGDDGEGWSGATPRGGVAACAGSSPLRCADILTNKRPATMPMVYSR